MLSQRCSVGREFKIRALVGLTHFSIPNLHTPPQTKVTPFGSSRVEKKKTQTTKQTKKGQELRGSLRTLRGTVPSSLLTSIFSLRVEEESSLRKEVAGPWRGRSERRSAKREARSVLAKS